MRHVQTAGEVIDALGAGEVARLTDRKPQHISNWRKARRLPAKTFLILRAALKEKQISASPSAWGIKEP